MKSSSTLLPSLAALAVAVAGCSDLQSPVSEPGDAGPAAPSADSGQVRASVTQGPFREGEQTLTVEIEGVRLTVGAYQGRLRFETGALEVARIATPEVDDSRGEYHVVNREATDRGLVRFAAFAVEGFRGSTALTLRFRTHRPVRPGEVEVELDAVATVEGKVIRADRIRVTKEALR